VELDPGAHVFYAFGFALKSGCDRVAQCHGVVADHAAQCRIVAGMASPWELAEQCRGMIHRRVVAWIRL
jgi:hypothetical protein